MEKPKPKTIVRYDFNEMMAYLSSVEDIDLYWPVEERPTYYRNTSHYLEIAWVSLKYWSYVSHWFQEDKTCHFSLFDEARNDPYYKENNPEFVEFCNLLGLHIDLTEDAYFYADY